MPPSSTLELQHTVDLCVRSLAAHADTLVEKARSTLVPSEEPLGADRADDVLARLRGGSERLVMGDLIGEGGMGVVNAATQVALGRIVAIKRARDAGHPKHERALVAEALITGSLEHPNVIPIYEIAVDACGAPMLVMKRIEGEPWSRLMYDVDAVRARSSAEPLVFHLKVLMEVCNAVAFAHSRQVIHRDLKPDNVLVGHFGEVYLADWGIATMPGVTTRVSGTPAYMAPEMLLCAELSPRTDVYLLGAILFEIVAGRPPHHGGSTEAFVSSILLSNPEIPKYVPDELAELVRACMARVPSDRPESARAVRQRIEQFLEHRGSTALATQADLLRVRIKSAIAREEPRTLVDQGFTECRFAYREALRSWADNTHATTGLRDLLIMMVEHALAHRDLAAAKLRVSELHDPPAAVFARITALEQSEQARSERMERLSRLEQELDPRVGRRARFTVGIGVGLLWALLPLVGWWVGIRFGNVEMLVTLPGTLIAVSILAVTGQLAGWRASQLNRRLTLTFGFVLLVEAVSLTVLYFTYTPRQFVTRGLFFYWFLATGIAAASIDVRLFPAALGYLAAFAVVCEWPASRYLCAMLVNLFFTITLAVIWLRSRQTPSQTDTTTPSMSGDGNVHA